MEPPAERPPRLVAERSNLKPLVLPVEDDDLGTGKETVGERRTVVVGRLPQLEAEIRLAQDRGFLAPESEGHSSCIEARRAQTVRAVVELERRQADRSARRLEDLGRDHEEQFGVVGRLALPPEERRPVEKR